MRSDCIFVTAPENVSWLLNMRGKDNPYSPIPNCRLILTKNGKIYLFAKKSKIGNLFKKNNLLKINIFDENKLKIFLEDIYFKKIVIDKLSCSVGYENILRKKGNISIKSDPIYQMKSIKNQIEIKNIIKSHISDGVSVTKFLYWIKNNKEKITELKAQNKLELLEKDKNYLYPSFNTISASGPNGAIIHYRATKSSNRIIKKNDIYLCDSGGQYNYGTTDITRTVSFEKQTTRIKNIFTRVLKGHIAVATANLNKIKSAEMLDKLARKFLKKKEGLDYPHGTGHGVGFFFECS